MACLLVTIPLGRGAQDVRAAIEACATVYGFSYERLEITPHEGRFLVDIDNAMGGRFLIERDVPSKGLRGSLLQDHVYELPINHPVIPELKGYIFSPRQ